MAFRDWVNLSEKEYNKSLLNDFEQEAFTKFTHIDSIKYDTDLDEIVLIPSVTITSEREEIIASQLQDVAEELNRPFNVVAVSDGQVRVAMPNGCSLSS